MSTPSDQDPPPTPDRDWQLALATALQTTLDPTVLVELFAHRVRMLVPLDGAEFVAREVALEARSGALEEHRASYELTAGEHHLGRLSFLRARAFEPREREVLESTLAGLVHPLRNALLYREAVAAAARDALTGTGNRTSLDPLLAREADLARRHATPLSLLMLDIDRFKVINDEYGHLSGDRALKAVAGCLVDTARDSDMVFRYGGEEFCVVLSNTPLEGARILAERLRTRVAASAVEHGTQRIPVTVSVGVAELRAEEDAYTLVGRADRAMYAAKRAGRNWVMVDAD